jgi:hypothetical protein
MLLTTAENAEGLLPFPDPQFTFAEVVELSRCSGAAAQRLAELLARMLQTAAAAPRGAERPRKTKAATPPK